MSIITKAERRLLEATNLFFEAQLATAKAEAVDLNSAFNTKDSRQHFLDLAEDCERNARLILGSVGATEDQIKSQFQRCQERRDYISPHPHHRQLIAATPATVKP